MQAALEMMLRKRRDRSIAVILGIKDRECDPHLPDRAKQLLRKVVLDQFNDFYEVVLDLVGSLDTGDVTLNEFYLQKIDDLHAVLVESAPGFRPQRLLDSLPEPDLKSTEKMVSTRDG